jgi:hypothetical protein
VKPRPTFRVSSWARAAMSDEAWNVADRLRLVVIGSSPTGPWLVRHPRLFEALKGADVDALVAQAAAEVTRV